MNPPTTRSQFNLAQIQARRGDTKTAVATLTAVLAMDPHMAVAWAARAALMFRAGDYMLAALDFSGALNVLRDADFIDYAPLGLDTLISKAELHYNRAICFSAMGRYQIAMDDASKAKSMKYDEGAHSRMNELIDELETREEKGKQVKRRGPVGFMLFSPGGRPGMSTVTSDAPRAAPKMVRGPPRAGGGMMGMGGMPMPGLGQAGLKKTGKR